MKSFLDYEKAVTIWFCEVFNCNVTVLKNVICLKKIWRDDIRFDAFLLHWSPSIGYNIDGEVNDRDGFVTKQYSVGKPWILLSTLMFFWYRPCNKTLLQNKLFLWWQQDSSAASTTEGDKMWTLSPKYPDPTLNDHLTGAHWSVSQIPIRYLEDPIYSCQAKIN